MPIHFKCTCGPTDHHEASFGWLHRSCLGHCTLFGYQVPSENQVTAMTCSVLVVSVPSVGFDRSVVSGRAPPVSNAAVGTFTSETVTLLGYAASSLPRRFQRPRASPLPRFFFCRSVWGSVAHRRQSAAIVHPLDSAAASLFQFLSLTSFGCVLLQLVPPCRHD